MYAPDQNLVAEFLERFSAKNTRAAYRQDLDHFFHFLGTTRVNTKVVRTIKPEDVTTWVKQAETEFSPSTVARRMSAVKGFFEWLVATQTLRANPVNKLLVRKTQRFRADDRPIVALTRQQATRLIQAADTPRDRALIKVLLYCMLRRGEVAAMDVEHIQEVQGHPIIKIPAAKGGADQFVKIPKPAHTELVEYLASEGLVSGPVWRSLSNRNRGERISPKTIYNVVVQTAIRAGLYKIYPHVLRHTGCTLAIEAGASVTAVKAHARHRSLNTTMTYVHQRGLLDDSAGDAIDLDD